MRSVIETEGREAERRTLFEQTLLPHLNAAYNLARWLTGRGPDAEDIVQEAYLRAWRFFDNFHGEEGRAWLLAIVRNTCYTWLSRNRGEEAETPFDEEVHGAESSSPNPEELLLAEVNRQGVKSALESLPVEFREVMILRELEGLSYKEIAGMMQVPVGTVMSRLARARRRLQEILSRPRRRELCRGV